MIHALVLLAILLFAAPLARFIPLAVLAAILFVVAYNMGEWSEIPQLLKLPWTDRAVWATTFGLTVFADLTVAVMVGMILAALLYIRKVFGLHKANRTLLLCGAREQPASLMHKAEFARHIGSENICDSIDTALDRAKVIHSQGSNLSHPNV
jgi:MFS superfamily sulfate permease-like transporter